MKKVKIHQNIWGNWNGYIGGKRVREFGTGEDDANEGEQEFMTKKNTLIAAAAAAILPLVAAAQDRPLGVFTLGKQVTPPAGFNVAYNFKVTQCPGTYDLPGLGNGQYTVRYPAGTPVAADVFIGGHLGQAYWTKQAEIAPLAVRAAYIANTNKLFDDLIAANHIVVQVEFTNQGWGATPAGQIWGFKTTANRVATAIKGLYDTIAAPLGIPMQMAGGSGGSAAILYALSFYGADQYLSRAIPISGPPFAKIAEGCDKVSGWEYGGANGPSAAPPLVDAVNGQKGTVTIRPCTDKSTDPFWVNWWHNDSVDVGGRYNYSNIDFGDGVLHSTQIDFIEGAKDSQPEIKSRENLMFGLIRDSGQTGLSFTIIPDMGHNVQASATAMQTVECRLLGCSQ